LFHSNISFLKCSFAPQIAVVWDSVLDDSETHSKVMLGPDEFLLENIIPHLDICACRWGDKTVAYSCAFRSQWFVVFLQIELPAIGFSCNSSDYDLQEFDICQYARQY
jgi:hypothetical protein